MDLNIFITECRDLRSFERKFMMTYVLFLYSYFLLNVLTIRNPNNVRFQTPETIHFQGYSLQFFFSSELYVVIIVVRLIGSVAPSAAWPLAITRASL